MSLNSDNTIDDENRINNYIQKITQTVGFSQDELTKFREFVTQKLREGNQIDEELLKEFQKL